MFVVSLRRFTLLLFVSFLLVVGYGSQRHTITAVSATTSMSAITSANSEATQIYLPLIQNMYASNLETPIFGVQMYNDTLTTNKYYDDLVESGTTWIRIPVRWRDAEPTQQFPKEYNWDKIDQTLAAAVPHQDGLKIIGTVYYAPDWAVPEPYHPRAVLNDDALPDFAQFVEALAARYSGKSPELPVVTHWEFYNEPDLTTEPGGAPLWGDNGDKYAQMLATAYPAVKTGNPEAQVVFGGIAYDAFVDQGGTFVREFLDDVLTAGGGEYFDIMNFHSYPVFSFNWTGKPWPEGGPGLFEKAVFIREKLETEYGLYKPMVITEAGWFSDNPPTFPSSQEIQARYVIKLHTQSMAADIDVMIWWMLYDAGIGYNDTGLVTNGDPTVRKLAFDVYQNMTEEMRTTRFERKLSDAETGSEQLEVYQFADSVRQRTLYIAWLNVANHSDPQSQALQFSAPAVTVKSMEGDVLQVINDGDDGLADGRVTVAVSNRPVYLEVEQ